MQRPRYLTSATFEPVSAHQAKSDALAWCQPQAAAGQCAPCTIGLWRDHADAEPASGRERSRGVTQWTRSERFRFRLISSAASQVCVSTTSNMMLENPLAASHVHPRDVWSMSGSVVAVTMTSSRPLTWTTLRLTRVEKRLCFNLLLECSGGSIGAICSNKKVVLFSHQGRLLALMTCCPRSSPRWCDLFDRSIAYEPSGCCRRYIGSCSLVGGGGGGDSREGAGVGTFSDAGWSFLRRTCTLVGGTMTTGLFFVVSPPRRDNGAKRRVPSTSTNVSR